MEKNNQPREIVEGKNNFTPGEAKEKKEKEEQEVEGAYFLLEDWDDILKRYS